MRLPRGEQAIVDLRKITDYLLSPTHPGGRHKARVFASALGLTAGGALHLASMLRRAAAEEEAVLDGTDRFGQRFHIDFVMTFGKHEAELRSAWLVPTDGNAPTFLTAYVL